MEKTEYYLIEEIINNELVSVFFEPLVFMNKKRVAGFRASCSGTGNNGTSFQPDELIFAAERYGLVLQIERIFRKKSFDSFLFFYRKDRESLLSISISSIAISSGFTPKSFLKTAESFGIDPSNIIIEIGEPGPAESDMVSGLISQYKALGFMVAMVIPGAGFSKWDSIIALRPGIIKLGRPVIMGISGDYFRQELYRSLINLAHMAGILVIADGIDAEEDALKMMDLKADILQGNYFTGPCRKDEASMEDLGNKINRLSLLYHEQRIRQSRLGEMRRKNCISILDRIIDDILKSGMYLPDDAVNRAIEKYKDLECIYILDESGIQVTDTVKGRRFKKNGIGKIFYPDSVSSDQSNKDYYIKLICGEEYYISEPYISAATGSMCVTASKRYITPEGEGRILCVDLAG